MFIDSRQRVGAGSQTPRRIGRRAVLWMLMLVVVTLVAPASARSKKSHLVEPTALHSQSAAEAALVVGDWYSVKVVRGKVEVPYSGCLMAATERWIVLRDVTVVNRSKGIPLLRDVPGLSDAVTRDKGQRSEADLWIPREAVLMTSHLAAASVAEFFIPRAPSKAGAEPPLKPGCSLTRVVNGERKTAPGGLLAVKPSGVVMEVQQINGELAQIPQAEILALEVPVMVFTTVDVPLAEKPPSQVAR
jgi:hypothetical protein